MVRTIIIRSVLALIFQLALENASAQFTKLTDFAGGTEADDPNGVLTTDGTYMYGVSFFGGTANMGTIYRTLQDGTSYTKLHDFTGANGRNPEGSLYYDGTYLYGMTYYGGTSDLGIIYKIMPDGTNYQKLLDFDGTNGQEPYGTFISDGTYLYGMTWKGGTNNLGRIFRILPDGTGYQALLDFAGATNGGLPASSLYYDGSFLYAMTSSGGANGLGTVFKMNLDGTGYDNLYDFTGGTDGREPYGALIGDGTYLYGATYFGGTSDNGTIFRLKPDGTNYSKLHDFAGGTGGSHPYTTLTLNGTSLYGVTIDGGSTNQGILFRIKPDGSGFIRLVAFTSATSGSEPYTTLLSVGPYLYGVTSGGGASGSGTMFRYKVTEAFTKLLDFTGPFNGLVPYGSLYSDGTFLYGMTRDGGANDMGTIFKIKPDGTGYRKLLDFAGSSNGSNAKGSLISDGTFLYGMTSSGGSFNYGTIFKIMPDGSGYQKLHEFDLTATGVSPESDLYYDGTWLYGLTPSGGANNRGIFFKIMPDGTGYVKLSDFGAPFDGNQPRSSLYYDGTFFYGTTNRGGTADMGTIFKIKADGSGLTKLLNFGVGTNGRYPEGTFVSDGTYLYGTTELGGANNYGSLFKIKPDGTGFSTILSFDNNVYGSSPQATPVLVDEFLYAMTFVGGPSFEGTIFKIKTDGSNFKKVHEFSSIVSGSYPAGNSLITDGTYFYGMTNSGGLNEGTVFRLKDLPGNFTLVDFAGATNGSQPTYTKLICDGTTLYGMAAQGGTNGNGLIFKVNSDGSSFTKLYDFGLSPDGRAPDGSLLIDGTVMYGMTFRGGTTNDGTIFKVNKDGTGYSKLFDFTGATTGTDPWGSLVTDGTYLYGMTSQGGASNRGVVFRVLKDGTGFLKLHEFAANNGYPVGDLTLIGTTLYGTTFYGGVADDGTLFKIETDGTAYTIIHEFGTPDGIAPYTGALVYDGTFLYGQTEIGGTFDDGIVFKIKPDGTGYTNLHNFQMPVAAIPLGALEKVGSALYGLTNDGGSDNLGTMFTVNDDGTGYQTLMEFDGVINGYDVLGTLCHCDGALYGMTASGGASDLGTLFKYVLPTPAAPGIPSITTFSPSSGSVGTTVTITGVNFSTTPANNIVYFGATRATVSAATATQLTVTVPSGATHERITVTVNDLIAHSKTFFLPVFTPSASINGCTFGPRKDFSSGTYPANVKIADLNVDGKPDIIASDLNVDSVAVLLANATDFASHVQYPTGRYPLFVRVADLDGDGVPDISTANDNASSPPNYVSVLLGNGNGTLAAKADFLVGVSPQVLAVADVNLDGKNDLIVPNSNETTVSVLLGVGDGTFLAKSDFPVNMGSAGIVIVDVNEDGNPDLAITNFFDNNVRLLLGDGTGNFSFSTNLATGAGPSQIAAGNFNNDTHLDLVTINYTANTISIFLGTGTGFGAKTDYATGAGPRDIALGDLNGDGVLDVAVANQTSNSVSLYQGVGNGTFLAKVDFATGATTYSVAIGDLNADGKADLVAANAGSNTVSVYYNTTTPVPSITSFSPASGPAGTSVSISGTNFSANLSDNIVFFGATRATVTAATATQLNVIAPSGATYQPISVSVGCPVAYSREPFLMTFAGGGVINACSFKEKMDFTIGASAEGVTLSDIDGDGKSDMIVTSATANNVSVYRNTGSSGVINASSFAGAVSFTTGTGPAFVATGDLNGDGRQDLVVSDNTAGTLSVFENISATGAIAFKARVILTTGVNPYRVAIGDLDADGRPDIAVTNAGSSTVSVFKNKSTSSLSFNPKVDFSAGTNPLGIAIADMDIDGYPDLVISNVTSNNASIFRNLGTPGSITTGTFAARVNFTTGTTPQDLAVGDLDGDGKLDFIVANQGSDGVSVFRNISTPGSITTGSFAARVDFAGGANPDGVAINDVDGDGKPDIMTVNSSDNTISLFKNTSTSGSITTSSFAAKVDFGVTGLSPNVGAIGDIDGDGKADIVIPNYSGTTVSVLRNTIFASSTPTISDVNPGNGPAGTSVAITGANFSGSPANNIVYFGATRSSVIDATSGGLTVTVPIGATYEHVSVSVNCLTAYSSEPFVSTFPGNGIIDATTFATKTDFATGGRPADVALADLDNDGKADIATVNDLAGTVSLLRNTSSPGSFSFDAKIDMAAGASSQGMKASDIDGDGKLDLITVSDGATQVSVHRNTSTLGSLSFQTRVSFATGSTPVYIDFSDLDGDGRTDLAVANRGSSTVSVYRNTGSVGTISFSAKQDFAVGTNPNGVAIGDLDGDGKPDVVTANRATSTISIFRNTSTSGTINFAARFDLTSGAGANGVAIGDLDGDGKMDIAVTNYTARTVSVFRNNSAPGSINAASFDARADLTNSATISPTYISLGDVNGDNRADILVGNDAGTLMQVHRNISSSGSLTSSSFTTQIDFTTGTRPHNVTSGDLDGDGKPEIVSANATSNTVSVLHNIVTPVPTITSFTPTSGPVGTTVTITGTNFSATPANNTVYFGATKTTVTLSTTTSLTVTVPSGATFQPISATVGALTAWSEKPFVVTFSGTGNISTNSFEPKVDFTGGAWSVAMGDFDNDGRDDIVSTTNADNTISIFRNMSTPGSINAGSLANKQDVTTNDSESVAVGDLDGDGKLDIAVANRGTNTVSILRNNTSSLISFIPKVDLVTGINPEDIAIQDLDADGKPELVVANIGSNTISIFKNTSIMGSISFATPMDYSAGTPETLAIADLDGDDKPDIAAATDNGFIHVLRNNSASGIINSTSFSSVISFTSGGGPGLAVGDIDGDGKPDLSTANSGTNTFSVLKNTSTPGVIDGTSFATKVDFATGSAPEALAISDLNGDGKPEIAVSNQLSATISVFKNTSTSGTVDASSFSAKADFITGTGNHHLALADVDGDGKNDMVSANYGDGTISILRNTVTNAVPAIAITVNGSSQADGSTITFSSLVLGVSETKDLIIANPGTAILNITAISTTGDFSIQGTAPTSVNAGEDETITLQFSPTQAGIRTGTVTLVSDGDIPTYVINLSGSGIVPNPVIEITEGGIGQGSGSDLDFSSTDIGTDELKDIIITNSGNAILVITDVQITGDFTIESAIPSSIGPGASETITIKFAPSDVGARTGTLTIFSNGDTPVFVLNLTGSGETEIEIYNVVTVNPNGKHDFLKIRNITFFPNNLVSIFDRWGNKVFETNNYDNTDNVFKGVNERGKDLPEGTYYYVIYKNNGDKPFTGFILLRR